MVATAISDDVFCFELIQLTVDLGLGGRINHIGEVVDSPDRLGKGLRGGKGNNE
jgi:hypothetical protein